jgi:hypothetical protein
MPAAAHSISVVSVARLDLRQFDEGGWDADVIRMGGSMRSAYAHLSGNGFILRGFPKVFGIYLDQRGEKVRIGLYTLVSRGKVKAFYDGLNMYPEYSNYWREAMTSALVQAGPGAYDYGWQWKPEPPRDTELRSISGVRIVTNRPIVVQGVNFANWSSWDAYYHDLSDNIKRNAKKATKLHPDLKVDLITGLAALARVPTLVAMRRAMYRRKNLPFPALRVLGGYVLSILAAPAQAMIGLVTGGGRVLAIQNKVEFGDTHYYLDGAAADQPDGAAWNLQLTMLHRAYDQSPKGRFLMGYTDVPEGARKAEGLLRSRQAVRVSDWPTSLIRFEYRPPSATA